jgi:ribosomal protein L37AE/L43A
MSGGSGAIGGPGVPPGRQSAPPGEEAGERQVPFYCPYCGDEDLRPAGPGGGSWRCGACARAFELRFAGVAPTGQATGSRDRDAWS